MDLPTAGPVCSGLLRLGVLRSGVLRLGVLRRGYIEIETCDQGAHALGLARSLGVEVWTYPRPARPVMVRVMVRVLVRVLVRVMVWDLAKSPTKSKSKHLIGGSAVFLGGRAPSIPVTPLWHGDHMSNNTVLSISCDTCAMRQSDACSDCLVTFMYEHEATPVNLRSSSQGAVVLDLDEQRALRLLASAGLVPTLRHREAI